jgi:hypothetical protein
MSNNKITTSPEDRFEAIEAHLAGTLKPITPRKDFVKHLRSRIHLPQRDEIAIRLHDWRTLLLVFGGVLSGALVIITVGRAFYHLFGRRNLG